MNDKSDQNNAVNQNNSEQPNAYEEDEDDPNYVQQGREYQLSLEQSNRQINFQSSEPSYRQSRLSEIQQQNHVYPEPFFGQILDKEIIPEGQKKSENADNEDGNYECLDEMIDNDLDEDDEDAEDEEDVDDELSQSSQDRYGLPHKIGEILEVKLEPQLDLNQLVGNNLTAFQNGQQSLQSTMFMVDFTCDCCNKGKRPPSQCWLYMNDLIENYGQDIEKLRQLEQVAIRELRERETKKHAKELTKYLNFEDVEDFTQAEFEEKNFSSSQSSGKSSKQQSDNCQKGQDEEGKFGQIITETNILEDLQNGLNSCPVIEGTNYKINPFIPVYQLSNSDLGQAFEFKHPKFTNFPSLIETNQMSNSQKLITDNDATDAPNPGSEDKILMQRSGYNSQPPTPNQGQDQTQSLQHSPTKNIREDQMNQIPELSQNRSSYVQNQINQLDQEKPTLQSDQIFWKNFASSDDRFQNDFIDQTMEKSISELSNNQQALTIQKNNLQIISSNINSQNKKREMKYDSKLKDPHFKIIRQDDKIHSKSLVHHAQDEEQDQSQIQTCSQLIGKRTHCQNSGS